MKIYHSVAEVFEDRRKGVTLDEVIDSLLMTPHVWQIHGLTPFSIIPQLYKTDFVDMSTDNWRSLPVELQMELARGYQQWYAHRLGLAEPEYTFVDGVTIEMRLVPPMKHWMGSTEWRHSNEKQRLKHIKKPFWIGKTQVTQEQWVEVMGRNPSHFTEKQNLPVERVSWDVCQEFCKKIGMLLPHDQEWELACRAGTTTRYSFGDDAGKLGDYGWYSGNAERKTHPVGEKLSNAFGLKDMYGNVWEWCRNRKSPFGGNYRMFRGGCWSSLASDCQSSSHLAYMPWHQDYAIGFRVMKYDF